MCGTRGKPLLICYIAHWATQRALLVIGVRMLAWVNCYINWTFPEMAGHARPRAAAIGSAIHFRVTVSFRARLPQELGRTLSCFMIAGSFDEIGTKTARDHASCPKCLNFKFGYIWA